MLNKLIKFTSKPLLFKRCFNGFQELIETSEEISQSILDNKPTVALESTVITHGMPWPVNFETALELESIVKEEGAVPVTIGVLNGKLTAGFSKLELEELAQSVNSSCKPIKISRHNIYNSRNIKYGGTTASGTMIVAKELGINIFGTGGIGGVHREVESTMDISTDLRELGRTPICVVSSGIKSFLDIPKSLEFLETEGVFVCTLDSKVFPNFFTRSCGIKSPNDIKTIENVAEIIFDMTKFQLKSGMLVAVPIPECLEKDGNIIHQAIIKSLENAKSAKVTGSYVTPFVLNQINIITNGKSLMLNVELIKNNVRVAAKLAKEFHKLKKTNIITTGKTSFGSKLPIVVIGGCMVDNYMTIKDSSVVNLETIVPRATYDCSKVSTCGGVGRNLAEVFHLLNGTCHFLSVLGKDFHGEFIKTKSSQLNLSRIKYTDNYETGNCTIISCENREILFHIGNISIFESITPDYLKGHLEELKSELKWICLDCNVPDKTMEYVIEYAKTNDIKVFIEPTDIMLVEKPVKVIKRFQSIFTPIDLISPNVFEFYQMIKSFPESDSYSDLMEFDSKSFEFNQTKIFENLKLLMKNSNLLDLIPKWIIKLGPAGVVFASKTEMFFIEQSDSFVNKQDIINTSGAGDCLAGCALLLHLKTDLSWKHKIAGSMRLVKESLTNNSTVPVGSDFNNYTESEIRKWTEEMFDRKLLVYQE